MDDQSFKLGFHLKHLIFKHRKEMDIVEKKSRKEEWVVSRGCSLRCLLKVCFGCMDHGSQRIC